MKYKDRLNEAKMVTTYAIYLPDDLKTAEKVNKKFKVKVTSKKNDIEAKIQGTAKNIKAWLKFNGYDDVSQDEYPELF